MADDLKARAEQLITDGYSDGDGLRDIPQDASEMLTDLLDRVSQQAPLEALNQRLLSALQTIHQEMREELFRAGNHPALGVPSDRVTAWMDDLDAVLFDATQHYGSNGRRLTK